MAKGIILCVDDDSTVLTALRTLLGKIFGADNLVEVAESGEEALEIADDHRARGNTVSVIISDYIMPVMRGDELLVKIHEAWPDTIKIMLTGQSDLEGVKKAINEANLYRFLEKPFNNADLVLTIRSALRAFDHQRISVNEIATLRHENAQLTATVAQQAVELMQLRRGDSA